MPGPPEVSERGSHQDGGRRLRLHPALAGAGDHSLQKELDALRKGNPLPLGKRALECARVDGEARAAGVSLFSGLHIPASHATLPSCVSPATIRIMETKGFKAGKIRRAPIRRRPWNG